MNRRVAGIIVILGLGVALGVGASNWWGPGSGSSTPAKTSSAAPTTPPGPGPAGGPPAAARTVGVEVAAVRLVSMPAEVSAVGTMRSENAVMLRPEVTGRISEIAFTEGQPVKQGQVLLRLDDSVVKAQLQQAQANLGLANSQYRRSETLTQQGFISKQARDESFSQLKVQQAAVALAQAQLDKTTILAPFDGIIGLRQVSVGDYVSPGIDIAPLESIDPLQVDFRVPEGFAGQLAAGQPLTVRFDALPGEQRGGVVKAINPQIDVGGRSVLVRADVPNPDGKLRPGLFARVLLRFNDSQALTVPETALQSSGAERFVFRVEDGKVRRVVVEIGQRRAGQVEIVRGVQEGDQVVVAGLQKISDGAAVRILAAPAAASAS
ncbi:MAG: efflux RND transporter periplasmic adaptor subunit [Pusillimonas sp.]